MEVLKNLRSTTDTKMLSATMPTKMAASHSIELIMRSMMFRFISSFHKGAQPRKPPQCMTGRPANLRS